ncbi:MAG: hypothetical protein ACOYT7_03680 [Patescibacteria group bacterium]
MWKTAFFGLIGVLVLVLVGSAAYFFGQGKIKVSVFPSSPEPSLGETPVPTVNEVAAIKQALYLKFKADATKLDVSVNKIEGNYATGNVKDVGSEVGGGYFLAAKVSGNWVIVHDGQASPTCSQLAPYDFPVSIVPECLDESGRVVAR